MKRFIADQFRKPSGFFGTIVSTLMKKGNMIAYDKIIPELAVQTNDKILEIGYGHGIGIDRLSSLYDCHVTGIDFSALMFKEACRRNRAHINDRRVELRHGNFLDCELEKDTFDKIFCINVIYFWENIDMPFSRIRDGLKPGGVFCMFMAHRDDLKRLRFTRCDVFRKYSIEEVTEALKKTGFSEIGHRFDKGYLIRGIK